MLRNITIRLNGSSQLQRHGQPVTNTSICHHQVLHTQDLFAFASQAADQCRKPFLAQFLVIFCTHCEHQILCISLSPGRQGQQFQYFVFAGG